MKKKSILYVSTYTEARQYVEKYRKDGNFSEFDFYFLIEFFEVEQPKTKQTDEWFLKDFADPNEIDNFVREISHLEFDYVVADDEYAMKTAALIRERKGIEGMTLADVRIYRDKVAMKEKLAGTSIPIPKLLSIKELKQDIANKTKVIVKPRAYGGANGVRLFDSYAEAANFVDNNLKKFSSSDDYQDISEEDLQIEEFIDGELYHLDGFVENGTSHLISASKYFGDGLAYQNGCPLGSFMIDSERELLALEAFTAEVIHGLGSHSGVFHLEAFKTQSGKMYFLEIGLRPGGALIIPSIKISHDIDLRLLNIYLQIGKSLNLNCKRKTVSGWLVFPKLFRSTEDVKVRGIDAPDFEKFKSLYSYELPKIGASAKGTFSYTTNNGGFLFSSESSSLIEKEINTIVSTYKVHYAT